MRSVAFAVVAVSVVILATSASAGNLTYSNDKAQWQSAGCTEPTEPASLLAVDRETHAGDMNKLMEEYNAYAGKMQDYMNCISKEAESDSAATSQTIVQSAEDTINAAQKKVNGLHDALQPKK